MIKNYVWNTVTSEIRVHSLEHTHVIHEQRVRKTLHWVECSLLMLTCTNTHDNIENVAYTRLEYLNFFSPLNTISHLFRHNGFELWILKISEQIADSIIWIWSTWFNWASFMVFAFWFEIFAKKIYTVVAVTINGKDSSRSCVSLSNIRNELDIR